MKKKKIKIDHNCKDWLCGEITRLRQQIAEETNVINLSVIAHRLEVTTHYWMALSTNALAEANKKNEEEKKCSNNMNRRRSKASPATSKPARK